MGNRKLGDSCQKQDADFEVFNLIYFIMYCVSYYCTRPDKCAVDDVDLRGVEVENGPGEGVIDSHVLHQDGSLHDSQISRLKSLAKSAFSRRSKVWLREIFTSHFYIKCPNTS
jgi:hypothetical protein